MLEMIGAFLQTPLFPPFSCLTAESVEDAKGRTRELEIIKEP